MAEPRVPVVLGRDEGRRYEMGGLTALFKADVPETGGAYAVSEWRLAPGQPGVGAHAHEANDELFFVTAGRPEILLGDQWRLCAPGDFLCIPAGVMHDFRNPGPDEARLMNVFTGDGFEAAMPGIVAWFAANG